MTMVSEYSQRMQYRRSRIPTSFRRQLASGFPTKSLMLRPGKVEAIGVHHLVPSCHEVMHEFLLRAVTGIDFCERTELGIRSKDKIDTSAGPLDFTCCAIAAFEHVLVFRSCLPCCVHVEQVHEEVIGEGLRPVGEDAVSRLAVVG